MSIDKSDVGHRHTASDIRGGKFPLAMLPDEVVTDDELTAAIAAIDVDVPAASDTVPGIVELADIAETNDGTDNTRAVTPYALSFRSATDVRTGLVELATVAEALTGTDTARAVTPAGVKAVADTKASTSHGHALTDAAITGTLAVAKGGTGGTTAADARTNLSVYSKAELPAGTSAWQSYTPTYTGCTATTLRARYIDIFGRISVQVDFQITGTPTANIGVSLPVTPKTGYSIVTPIGLAEANVTGTTIYTAPVQIVAGIAKFRGSNTAEWGVNSPAVWASNQVVAFICDYERA